MVSLLLDTCAISDVQKPSPNAGVLAFFAEQSRAQVYLSVVTIGEIRKGIARLPDGRRRRQLELWLVDLREGYGDHILPVDVDVAEHWGGLSARLPNLAVADGLIAATALRFDLRLVTRNTRDFADTGVPIIDPWE